MSDSRRTRELRAVARAVGELLDILDDEQNEVLDSLSEEDAVTLARASSIAREIARGALFR